MKKYFLHDETQTQKNNSEAFEKKTAGKVCQCSEDDLKWDFVYFKNMNNTFSRTNYKQWNINLLKLIYSYMLCLHDY